MTASIVPIPAVNTASMAYAGTTPRVGLAFSIDQLSILRDHHCQHNIFHQDHQEEHLAFHPHILRQSFLLVLYAECNQFVV